MSFETIYGLSTLAGKSGVAVIRISGNNALQIAKKFCVIDNIKPNYVKFVKFKFPNSDKAIDILEEIINLYARKTRSIS